MSILHSLINQRWDDVFSAAIQEEAMHALESGNIIFFSHLPFQLLPEEQYFLSPKYADPKTKNISFIPEKSQLRGVRELAHAEEQQLTMMMDRYYRYALGLVKNLFPRYHSALMIGRTSFRPVEISGRKTSYRKDDKRLHVDAFPSTPNQGKRILRVFCNINPQGEDRIWRVGEPFEKVVQQFLPKLSQPLPGLAVLMQALKLTKSMRTPYDHYMLQLHDQMKGDDLYQEKADQTEIKFSPGNTWIVQTDHVSHAAMQGQYCLEQTFYLPISAMRNEAFSPLRVLERVMERSLT